MSILSYDSIAFNSNGKKCKSIFKNIENGNSIEMYKDWVYVHSKKMYNKKASCFSTDVIAEIREGEVDIGGFNIIAKRNDTQNAIFVYVCYGNFNKRGDYKILRFSGIGCYGYKDKVKEILSSLSERDMKKYGLSIQDIRNYDDWFDSNVCKDSHTIHSLYNFKLNKDIIYWDEFIDGPYDVSKDWVGISSDTKKEFFIWLEGIDDCLTYKNWVMRCKKSMGDIIIYPMNPRLN
jgi:hypothetical protein